MRQGYYSAVPETSKLFMSDDEWGFWYEGKAAKGDIVSPQADRQWKVLVLVRDGGSFIRSDGCSGLLEFCYGRKPVYGT